MVTYQVLDITMPVEIYQTIGWMAKLLH